MKGQAEVCLCILLLMAVFTDIRTGKIKNVIILMGFLTAIVCRWLDWNGTSILSSLLGVLLPIVVLLGLFLLHMLGAGDIKLFCMAGVFVGGYGIIICIAGAFVAGAVMAVWKMLWHRNFQERFLYLFRYIAIIMSRRKILPYYKQTDSKSCIIHFSVPIAISVCIYLGVCN